MEPVKVGDRVCWAKDKRTVIKYSSKLVEDFTVQNVHANGRCDLKDRDGGELFNIPVTDLERVPAQKDPQTPIRFAALRGRPRRLKPR